MDELETFAQRQARVRATVDNNLYLGQSLDRMLDKAEAARQTLQDQFISVEHLLLGFQEDERIGRRLLRGFNVEAAELMARGAGRCGATRKVIDQNPESQYEALEKYGRDLTQEAREGRLDPVIGRDEEIRRVIQVLSRRTKNNPVLIGEPGVGKTAIAEALAQRIINGDVPESLKGRTLISLDIGGLIAGAKYRGEFEDRLRTVLGEVTSSEGQIVLFIDELHTVGGGLVPARAPWMPATCSNPCWPEVSCAASGPPPWMSIASTSKKMLPWNGGFSRCTSTNPAPKMLSPFCGG